MRDYLKIYAITALAILLSFVSAGLYQGPISGDLTRLGYFAERDFRPAGAPLVAVPFPSGDVVEVEVLGDSFSAHNYWQPFVENGALTSIATTHWLSLSRPDCVLEWIRQAKEKNPALKVVVLQAVERAFVLRFEHLVQNCSGQRVRQTHQASGSGNTLGERIGLLFPDPIYTLRAIGNSIKTFDSLESSGKVGVVPLIRNDLFTNQRSNKLLYFHGVDGDQVKLAWNQSQVSTAARRLRELQDSAAAFDVKILVAIIPDKSTVYRPYMVVDPFEGFTMNVWAELNAAGVRQINVKDYLARNVESTRDLYAPNDTHFGVSGYRLFAEQVRMSLLDLLAPRGP